MADETRRDVKYWINHDFHIAHDRPFYDEHLCEKEAQMTERERYPEPEDCELPDPEPKLEKWQSWQAELAKKVDAQKAIEDKKDLVRNDKIAPDELRPSQDYIERCVGAERRSDHELMQDAQKELAVEIRKEREVKESIEAHNADIDRQKMVESKREALRIKFERDRQQERDLER